MTAILGAQLLVLLLYRLTFLRCQKTSGTWLPIKEHIRKRRLELWFLGYGVVWITAFGIIIGLELYEDFDAKDYLLVCFGLALPLYLQPLLMPSITADEEAPLLERYSLKANVWLVIFGFTGNYWYTHYFYSVLDAAYTMPSYRLNGVPIAMFCATHFYFCFYHALSNAMIRKIRSTYEPSIARFVFLTLAIASLSYATAFAETLTISRFPYWTFADRDLAYTLGSAFYGLYFIVSFPAFYVLDELPFSVVDNRRSSRTHSFPEVIASALASSMAVLFLLDFVRISIAKRHLDIPAQPSVILRTP